MILVHLVKEILATPGSSYVRETTFWFSKNLFTAKMDALVNDMSIYTLV